MGDVPLNSVCSKCGAKNTLEVDPEGDLHCFACGETEMKTKKVDYLVERHKFYEDNKAAILADVKAIGEKATAKKWKVNGASLYHVLKRWEREAHETKDTTQKAAIPKKEIKSDYKRHRQGVDVHERSKYYEDNKEAIIVDLLSSGRKMTRQKWGITSSSLFNLEKKWLTPEQKAAIPEQSNRHRKHASSDRPVFSLISILDQSMIGLLQKLPKHGAPWRKRERESWKRAFDALFEFLYPITS
jgi:hypothetical protein